MTLSNIPRVYRASRGTDVPAAMIGSVYDGIDGPDPDGFWNDPDYATEKECETCGYRWDPAEESHSHARRFGALIIPGRER